MKRIEEIPTDNLLYFEGNPRFDSMIHEGLFEDIKKHGILVPILVAPANDGQYYVIDGERRRKSAIELKIPKITCIIEEMDEQTQWNRAMDLNALNRPFSSMEIAKNLYRRKIKFQLSDEDLSNNSSYTDKISQVWITKMISLNKLPDNLQKLIHNEKLPMTVGYELSQLAFDVSFPGTGPRSIQEWIALDPETNIWDFDWSKEPDYWKKRRIKHQSFLANRFINSEFVEKNQFQALKKAVMKLISDEQNERARLETNELELQQELQELEEGLPPIIESFNRQLKEDLIELIPEKKLRTKSSLRKYLLKQTKMPGDFHEFIYNFQDELNQELPNEKHENIVRDALNKAVTFEKRFKKKDPIIFEVVGKPTCFTCGNDYNQEKLDDYYNFSKNFLDSVKQKRELIIKIRNRNSKLLHQIQDQFINRLEVVKNELKELQESREEK